MRNRLSQTLRRYRYGAPIIVVSGLPRSGTSMLMSMLRTGGLDVFADNRRVADEDNPKGYFEHERVKKLESDPDRTWLREARGKAIKIVSHLLRSLPSENHYRILLATRDLREVLVSQNRMLARLNEDNPVDDEKALRLYARHLQNVRTLGSVRSNFEIIEIPYAQVVRDPRLWSTQIASFVAADLDPEGMASVVESRLYRNRAAGGEMMHGLQAGVSE